MSPKHPKPQREKRWRETAKLIYLPHQYGPIATYKWGDSDKTVLLLHGWGGRGPQMGAFVEPLLKAGYQVVTFDAPGHGQTPGKSSNIFRMSDALQAVVHESGPIEAVIAHSFGVMLLTYALKHSGFNTVKAVCISSPTTPVFLLERFCQALQVNEKVKQRFTQYTEQQYSNEIWQRLFADSNARTLAIPALVIHDRDDHDVPCQLGKQLADAWPNAFLHLTKGLGHRRILRNHEVIQTVVRFIA